MDVLDDRKYLRYRVMSSIFWLAGLKYVGQVISWGITIVVIRILTPGDYGLMAMASICINFLVILSELGLGAAIVQKKDLQIGQLSQLFGFIILSHGLLFIGTFFGAISIASYFSEPRLIRILQVLSLNFLFLTLYIVPQSILIRNMDFRRKSTIDLIGTILSALFTLVLAVWGMGVWSLVWGSMLVHIIHLIGYNSVVSMRILPTFKLRGIKEFISFGGYIFGSRVLWYLYSRADILIGGRMLGNVAIGVYSVALELVSIPIEKFIPIIVQVAFPAFSTIQSERKLVVSHFLKSMRLVGLVVFPIFWGLLVIAPEFLTLLLGSKWNHVARPVQILCIIMPFRALGSLFSPMLMGIGRPDVNFLYVAIAFVLMPGCFFVGSSYGIVGISVAWVIGYAAIFFLTLKLSLNVLRLSFRDFLPHFMYAPCGSLLMVIAVASTKILAYGLVPLLVSMAIAIITGVFGYACIMYLGRRELLQEAFEILVEGSRSSTQTKR